MNLILLGPPGGGKGTHGELLSKYYHIPVVSTGNMIREAVKNQTEMGKAAKAIMDSGNLLDDEIVIGIVEEKLAQPECANGFILDGFPRTIGQAEALEKMDVKIDTALEIQADDDFIVKRLAGRRVCPDCGNSYHITNRKPKVEGICDDCGGKLVVRDDDDPDTIYKRLRIYHETTEPLLKFYASRNMLRAVKCMGPVDEIQQRIQDAVSDLA